jgi:hypothetical protein
MTSRGPLPRVFFTVHINHIGGDIVRPTIEVVGGIRIRPHTDAEQICAMLLVIGNVDPLGANRVGLRGGLEVAKLSALKLR